MNMYSEYVSTKPNRVVHPSVNRAAEQDDNSNTTLHHQHIKFLQRENAALRVQMERAKAETMVVQREGVNRAIYCERINMDCTYTQGLDIPGCGGNNVKKNTIHKRESMCTEFEHRNHDWVKQRDQSNMETHSHMQYLMDNNRPNTHKGPSIDMPTSHQSLSSADRRIMGVTSEAKVVEREHLNRVIYCQMKNMDCHWVAGHDIPGCGGKNIKQSTIRQREAMCTEFELRNHDWVKQRDKSDIETHSHMQHRMDNNLHHAYNGPDVPYRSHTGEIMY